MSYEQELASFIYSYKTNAAYRREITSKYYNYLPLTDLQIDALENVIKLNKREEKDILWKDKVETDYSKANELLYGSDEEIMETILNLLFGEVLFKILEDVVYSIYKERMIDNRFLNKDKKDLISLAYDDFNRLRPVATLRFKYVKDNIRNGLKEKSFEPYSAYNTNISIVDIYNYALGEEEEVKTK